MALSRKVEEVQDVALSTPETIEDAGGFTRSRKYLKGKSKKAIASRNRGSKAPSAPALGKGK